MKHVPQHISRVFGTPCRGVYSTHILSGHHFGRHWHETFGFGYLEDGGHASASGRGDVRAYAGDVITVNPGEVHDGRPLGAPTRRWRIVYVDVDVMASLIHRDTHPEICRPVIEDRTLTQALRRLFQRLERWSAHQGATADRGMAFEESLVEASMLLMSRHGTVPPSTDVPPEDVRNVRDWLADDALDPPTLAEMAAATGLSRYQLLRRFERSYGLPPHAWLLRRRVERARVLIRHGSGLAAAAAGAGFADQSHMTRVFVKQYGFTPGAWQRAVTSKRSLPARADV